MMLPREKIQVTLTFLGIFCCIFGVVLLDPFGAEKKELSPQVFKVGAWKDGGFSKEGVREYAPWIIGMGVVSFIGVLIARNRD